MDATLLENYQLPPSVYAVALIVCVPIGAWLLMATVRWSERFSISFGRALIVTALAVIATVVSQYAVLGVQALFGWTGVGADLLGVLASLVLMIVLNAIVYAYGVKRPNGELIGLARSIKVTLIQLALSVGLVLVLAIVIAILVLNGVITLPDLPSELTQTMPPPRFPQ